MVIPIAPEHWSFNPVQTIVFVFLMGRLNYDASLLLMKSFLNDPVSTNA